MATEWRWCGPSSGKKFIILLLIVLSPLLVNSWINVGAESLKSYYYCRSTQQQHVHFLSTVEHQDDANNSQPNNKLLVFGLGNVGSLVAKIASTSLPNNFERVYGTTRSGKEIVNVDTIQFDSYEDVRDIIPSCTHILVTIPPIDSRRPRNWSYFCDPVLNNPSLRLSETAKPNTWIGYVSSTSVYGNHNGDWVNEDSDVKCEPTSKGALYLRAENEWIAAAKSCGWKMNVFRCAGLYGDGRSALHTIRKRGIQQETKSTAAKVVNPTSRIHEEDAARAILSAMQINDEIDGDTSFQLYNLADDNPAPRSEVMVFGHELLGGSNLLPSQTPLASRRRPSERESRRKTDKKQVDNKRMKERLLPEGLLYPTYREGLKAVLDVNREKWR
ncbi:hypothetical protein ACHAWT_009320 [Skeletonema menzelii]